MPAAFAIAGTIGLGILTFAVGVLMVWRPDSVARWAIPRQDARPGAAFLRVSGAILVLGGISIGIIGFDGLVSRL